MKTQIYAAPAVKELNPTRLSQPCMSSGALIDLTINLGRHESARLVVSI